MSKSTRRATLTLVVGALTVGLMWSAACNSNNPATDDGVSNGPPGSGGGTSCGDHPSPGCPCSVTDLGTEAACGKVELRVGSYVSCSMGKTTCDGSRWGACIGDTVVAKSFSGGGLKIQALGSSGPCVNDPCDPYCQSFDDNAPGVDAASPLVADDSGLYIGAGAGSCLCDLPSSAGSLYSNIIGTNRGNPAGCSGNDAGSSTDNCNHDYHCVGGTCQPYPVSGVNPSCGTAPDYTLGLGCYDGSSWSLELCNRGYVPSPGVGQLVIGINNGSPNTAPGACTTGSTGASWPTGPGESGSSPEVGRCVIDSATTSIGPGQCIDIDVATKCTQLDGTTPLNAMTAQQHWAVVNPSTALLPGTTPIPECDTCNNYTAWEKSSIPPLLANAGACVPSTCGTVCGGASDAGVEGGTGCHTYVSGTVYDPGGNIPLPGVAVYEPNAPLSAFSAGVSCDTCASVLPPSANIVSSTFSDLNGTFALEVDATSGVPVVFQTGRWRRKLTIGVDTPALTACAVNDITVPADCYLPGTAVLPNAWPATNCKTRLPQTSAEGDIPLTAVVTGTHEPFECSIAKFMGGGNEFGLPGSSKRVQLFQDTGADTYDSTLTLGSGSAASVDGQMSGIGAAVTTVAATTATISYLYDHTRSGSGWTIGTPNGSGDQTISGLSGMSGSYVNGTITLSGSTKPTDNGTFVIKSSPSSSKLTIHNPTGVSDATGGGTRKWRAGYGGLLDATWVGAKLTIGGMASGGNNVAAATVTSVVDASTLKITNASATVDANNGQAAVTWTLTKTTGLVIGNLSGMNASAVGATLVLSGASQAGNNGSFVIGSVVSPTQVKITNAAAFAETSDIAWQVVVPGASSAIPDAAGRLFDTQAHVNAYDELIMGCGGNTSEIAQLGNAASGAAEVNGQGYFYNYMKAGGRLFGNHWSVRGLLVPSTAGYATAAWNSTSTFASSIQTAPQNSPLSGRVSPNATPKTPHSNFQSWLTAQGAYAGGGVNTPQPVTGEALNPSSTNAFEWLRGSSTSIGGTGSDDWGPVPAGNFSLIYSIDTNASGVVPTLSADGGAGAGCGRTILSDMHVDTSRSSGGGSGGTFPSECLLGAPLSPNEQAFEYLFFVLSSCAVGGAPIIASAPPPPPPPPPIGTATFTREYHAVCPSGTAVVWQSFSWTAAIPTGTSIVFQAQTANDVSGGAGVYGVAVPVGSATVSTGSTAFTPATTVDQDLTSAIPPQKSLPWLLIKMTFNPSGAVSPVLESWNQAYDCVPSE